MPCLCIHSRDYIIFAHECVLYSFNYRYFKHLPDPVGPESETLPSASIKATNEAVHAGRSARSFETTEGLSLVTLLVTVQIRQCLSEYSGHAA